MCQYSVPGDQLHYNLNVHGLSVDKYTVIMVSEMILVFNCQLRCFENKSPYAVHPNKWVLFLLQIELFQINLLCQYMSIVFYLRYIDYYVTSADYRRTNDVICFDGYIWSRGSIHSTTSTFHCWWFCAAGFDYHRYYVCVSDV